MKRRKKNASISDLSSASLSPKKHIPNGYTADYRSSSPETAFNSPYHSIQYVGSNGTINNTNGHNHSDELNDPISHHLNDFNMLDTVSQNGSIRSDAEADCESPMHSNAANHRYDDSDSASSSVNQNSGSSGSGSGGDGSSRRQPRTPEDFYLFCQFILEYANYNEMCNQEVRSLLL